MSSLENLGSAVGSIENPMPGFEEIQDKDLATPGYLAAHNPPLKRFYADLAAGSLPSVCRRLR
jgi:hypothetical protein